MSKVVFQAERAFHNVTHDHLFHVGYQPELEYFNETLGKVVTIATPEQLEERAKLPASHMVNRSYVFSEGEAHNQLTLETDEEITAMREYVKTTDNFIVELDEEGNFPAEPEGTPFIAKIPHKVLTPAMYRCTTTAEGKTFRFNMGEERNKYITTDAEEISIIRGYIKAHANTGITDPTYKDPLAEE